VVKAIKKIIYTEHAFDLKFGGFVLVIDKRGPSARSCEPTEMTAVPIKRSKNAKIAIILLNITPQ